MKRGLCSTPINPLKERVEMKSALSLAGRLSHVS